MQSGEKITAHLRELQKETKASLTFTFFFFF